MRWLSTVFLFLFTLHGCSSFQKSAAVPVAEPVVQIATPPAKKILPPQVIILVSENIPAYSDVAKELASLLGQRGSTHFLTGNKLKDLKLINKLRNNEHTQFASIGLNASVVASTMKNRQIVFSQVYNYQDYALISSRHKGVSMLPSLNQTFNLWRTLSPKTTDIGVITGPGLEDVIESAMIAAHPLGIRLHHEMVKSDKEYQYAYKKLSKKVQGYWLLPDNRVLSENTLRDIMNFSVRNSKPVGVFNDELLKLGGLLSLSSEHHDIAHLVYDRLEQAQTKDNIPGPDIVYSEKLNLRINSVMANNLGLNIPEQYRKFSLAP